MNYVLLFPGQGAQSVGMMAPFAEIAPIRETFAQAHTHLGIDFWTLQEQGSASELSRTTITQPLLLTVGVALYRYWQTLGAPLPTASAGHSLGEYCALVCAGVLDFATALQIVSKRAELMANTAGEGAMAAILNAPMALIEQACALHTDDQESVEAVNFNTPEQVVIAGHRQAVDRACEWLKQKGVKRALLLPVSGAFHSRLMHRAAEEMKAVLAQAPIHRPQFPVIHNATLSALEDPEAIRQALAAQVSAPVNWVATIAHINAMGIHAGVECAPGKILAGLNRRINAEMAFFALTDPQAMHQALEGLGG